MEAQALAAEAAEAAAAGRDAGVDGEVRVTASEWRIASVLGPRLGPFLVRLDQGRRPGCRNFGWRAAYRQGSLGREDMSRYVDPTEQLVTELVVADVRRSATFYRDLGFQQLRDDGNFLELSWEGHRLFLLAAPASHDVVAPAWPAESPIRWRTCG